MANVGQVEDWKAVEQKALKIGAKKMIIEGMLFILQSEALGLMGQQICKKSSLKSLLSEQYVKSNCGHVLDTNRSHRYNAMPSMRAGILILATSTCSYADNPITDTSSAPA